jgi:hypothetical protein
MDRPQLGVAVGHVQQAHVAERRQVVQALLGRGGVGIGMAAERHARGAGRGQHLQEITLGQRPQGRVKPVPPPVGDQKTWGGPAFS